MPNSDTTRTISGLPCSSERRRTGKRISNNCYKVVYWVLTFGLGRSVEYVDNVVLLVLRIRLHWSPKRKKIPPWIVQIIKKIVQHLNVETCWHDMVQKMLLLQFSKYVTCPEKDLAVHFLYWKVILAWKLLANAPTARHSPAWLWAAPTAACKKENLSHRRILHSSPGERIRIKASDCDVPFNLWDPHLSFQRREVR